MWYRVLAGFMALAMACSVVWMVWVGVEIFCMEPPEVSQISEGFIWKGGLFSIEGRVNSEGVLSEMVIRRTD